MGNRMWFIHLHAFVEGSESVVSVKRIDFNPTYLEWYDVELGYKAFSIGDDEISLSVKFAYFE